MDRFRGAVGFAKSISVSMSAIWLEQVVLESCRLTRKGGGYRIGIADYPAPSATAMW
jgi:hypothetical protein